MVVGLVSVVMYSLSTTLDCKAINYTQQVLNETQEAKEQGLEALRKWLTINAHLHAKSGMIYFHLQIENKQINII